jgi:hypothetical protein
MEFCCNDLIVAALLKIVIFKSKGAAMNRGEVNT